MASLQRQFTDEQLESAVTASNTIKIVKNHDRESMGLKGVGAGKHSRDTFSVKDKAKTRKYIIERKPFDKREGTDRISFEQKSYGMFSRIKDSEDFENYVISKKDVYESHISA